MKLKYAVVSILFGVISTEINVADIENEPVAMLGRIVEFDIEEIFNIYNPEYWNRRLLKLQVPLVEFVNVIPARLGFTWLPYWSLRFKWHK